MNGNFVLPYYDINYIVKNVTVLFHDQINKKTVFHYVIVCKDQPSNYCYSSEQTLKFFANSTSYEVYNRISYQDLDVLKIYFQSKTFEIIDIQITVIPLEFNNLKIIDLHMKNELTLQNYSLYFNGSIEIQPYLPKISALLKVSSSGEYFIDEIRTCSSPFEFYFKLINKNIDSKWRKLDLIYIHFVNECSIEDSKFSIEIITPGFVLPYSTYSNGEIKRNIYNEQNVNNLIEFKQGGNSDEAVTSKIAVLQSEHKLSITFDINNKLTVLLNIQKSENNSGGLSSYHMMNFSIFSDADRLGNFLQTIEILEFDRQKSRRILNFLETCQVKYNVSIYLLHLIKQNNVSLMLFQLNLTSSLPLLTENKIDEIDVTYENERKSSSHLILFDCYIKKIKAIHHKSYFTVSTQMPFLKAEMYINKLLGFKQNQNWLIEVTNDYHQFRFCILFNQDHIIMISYNFIDFTLVIIIEKIVHLTTNLLNFISKLSQYTNSYNHKQINNNQVVTKQPNVNSDCSLQIVIETSNLFNLTFKLQLYKQVGIMQIQRILSTNLNLSSKLSSISSTRCVFILKQNISQEQLVYNLIYQGYVENFLNDSHMQINFSSETNNRVDRNITTTTTTTNVQINTNIVFHSEMNAKLLFISELHGPLTVEFHVFETKEEIGKPVFYTYAIYDAFNQDKNMYSFNMGTRRRSINSTVFNSHQKRHIDVLLYLDSLSSVCAFCIQYWSEDHKRSLSIKTPYRQLLYAVEDNQSNNGNNVYGNKTLKLKSIELLNSKAPKDTETELTIYENHFPPSEYGAGEKLEYVGFYLKSNILKQRFFSFLSEINRDEEKVHLTVTINHEQQTNKKNADHQLIFIWPYTWKRKNIYPSLFIKTVDSFVNLTGKYVHQPGILNASLQIETNDQAAYWKLYWERWYFIRIMIDKHMELNYKLVYNDNVAENNNIIQITCQLSNLEDSLNFSHMTSMSYRNNDKNVNNGNLFIVNSVVECSKQNTGIHAQLNTDYSTFIQVTTRDKSTNDDYLNCRLLANLDRSNTFNLFSYLRPELSEDILVSLH
ncbi:unnamed protein product [Heterobilharzia americana]|nr:unnamed protein product [Heterobilharzia americana]